MGWWLPGGGVLTVHPRGVGRVGGPVGQGAVSCAGRISTVGTQYRGASGHDVPKDMCPHACDRVLFSRR